MIEIESCQEGDKYAYSLLFQRYRFLFIDGMELRDLCYFSVETQNRLGKIKIKFNLNLIKHLPHSTTANYIILTKYQQILLLPFLLRNQKESPLILTTKLAFQSAKIYLQDFYQTIKKIDQIAPKPSYEQQSLIYDQYESQYDLNLEQWVQLFTKKQIQTCLSKCVPLNYGQVYDTDKGIKVTPYPSGYNLGSAVWVLESIRYKEKILWINDICHHNWRACKEFNIGNIHQNIDMIIFSLNSLKNVGQQREDEFQCVKFFDNVKSKLNENKNCTIIVDDMLYFADFINYISLALRDRFHNIFINNYTTTKLITYANSYVDFLSSNHAKRIYEDPPNYPFENFNILKNHKKLYEGSMEEIAEKHKIPTKELLLRATPYMHFVLDFYAYLYDGKLAKQDTIFEPKTSKKRLKEFMFSVNCKRVFVIEDGNMQTENVLSEIGIQYEKIKIEDIYQISYKDKEKRYIAQGKTDNINICKRKNDFILMSKYKIELRLGKLNWQNILLEELVKKQVKARKEGQKVVTESSEVSMKNYEVKVKSINPEEIMIIGGLLKQIMTKVKFK